MEKLKGTNLELSHLILEMLIYRVKVAIWIEEISIPLHLFLSNKECKALYANFLLLFHQILPTILAL